MEKIKGIRSKIDKIDYEISNLLIKRKDLVLEIGEFKKKQDKSIRNRKREKEIILNIKNKAKNKIEEKYLVGIFKAIIKKSRVIQK